MSAQTYAFDVPSDPVIPGAPVDASTSTNPSKTFTWSGAIKDSQIVVEVSATGSAPWVPVAVLRGSHGALDVTTEADHFRLVRRSGEGGTVVAAGSAPSISGNATSLQGVDVELDSPGAGDVLTVDGGSGKWTNQRPASGLSSDTVAALGGTSGAPSGANPFVTAQDVRILHTFDNPEHFTGAGALDPVGHPVALVGAPGTGTAYTLGDASVVGQEKTVCLVDLGVGGTAVITPSHMAGTSVTLSAKWDSVRFKWLDTGGAGVWVPIQLSGTASVI